MARWGIGLVGEGLSLFSSFIEAVLSATFPGILLFVSLSLPLVNRASHNYWDEGEIRLRAAVLMCLIEYRFLFWSKSDRDGSSGCCTANEK